MALALAGCGGGGGGSSGAPASGPVDTSGLTADTQGIPAFAPGTVPASIPHTASVTSIPPPPPAENSSFPPFDHAKPMTKKEYLIEIHWKGADDCKGCHALMDPLGFAMESYDAIGRFRTEDENGLAIDPSGEMSDFGAFADMEELSQLMYDEPRAMNCIVSNLFRQSMGHKETKGERPAVMAIQDAFEASGFKLQDAIVELVASPAFIYVDAPK